MVWKDRDAHRAAVRQHYRDNKVYYLAKAKKWTKAHGKKIHAYVLAYLLKHPCLDCGEEDPIVLEFDHRDRKKKLGEIADMIWRRRPLKMIKAEIKKCDVRCANCHRRKTYRENNSTHRSVAETVLARDS